MLINGKDLILGRLASFVAKKAMLGEKVDVINCEEVAVTGNKKTILANYRRKRSMGVPSKGPFFPRKPEMIVKRSIRGMVPYKQPKGRTAFEKIKCYIGAPEKIKGEAIELKQASVEKLPNYKYIKIKDIAKELGWQK